MVTVFPENSVRHWRRSLEHHPTRSSAFGSLKGTLLFCNGVLPAGCRTLLHGLADLNLTLDYPLCIAFSIC